jgi:hypothetical protein
MFGMLSPVVGPTPTLASVVLLVLPLTRLSAAPVALYWNRHR